MPKTMGAIATEIRDRLDEASASFWTDVQIRKWINEGCRDVARRSETLLSTSSIAVTAGTQSYAAPADVVRVNRAEWIPTGQTTVYPLEYKDYNGMDAVWWTSQQVTQGYPTHFTMWGYPPSLNFILYPVPSTGGVLKVFYYKLSPELATDGSADSTNLTIAEGWWDLVIDYAEYIALRKDADPRWQEAKGLYEEHLQELADVSRRWSDQAGSVEFGMQLLPSWLVGYGDY